MMFSPSTPRHLAGGRSPAGKRRGVAAVEFAVVLPVLAIFMIGLFELGRAMMVKELLSDAVRKGCRNAILPAHDNAGVLTDVRAVLTDNGIDASQASITILVNDVAVDVSTAQPGDKVSVQVSIPFSAVSWTGTFYLTGQNMTEAAVMMRQG